MNTHEAKTKKMTWNLKFKYSKLAVILSISNIIIFCVVIYLDFFSYYSSASYFGLYILFDSININENIKE
jgi:hypothetical protein